MEAVPHGFKAGAVIMLANMSAQVAAATGMGLEGYSVKLLGVPFSVLGMAAAGSMMSFAFGTTENSRKKLFAVAIASTFIGAAAVKVVPALFHFDWVSPAIEPPLGFFFALFARWAVPLFIDVIPAFFRSKLGIPPTPPKNGDSP